MILQKTKNTISALLGILGVLFVVLALNTSVFAQTVLPNRSLKISDPRINQTGVNYTVGFSITGAGYTLGSVSLLFCDNSPLIGLPCTPPSGFDISGATIINQTGVTDFSIAPGITPNSLLFTRTPSLVGATDITIELDGVTNPSAVATYFGRLQTFSSDDGTGVAVTEGGVTFATTTPVSISTEVPPYLFLCVAITLPGFICSGASGNFIDFGEFSSNSTSTGTSQMSVATNAGSGFVVYITGLPPTSGNNVIPGMATRGSSQTGVSQFGLNLRDNSNPDVGSDPAGAGSGSIASDYNVPNEFKFLSGEAIVSSNTTSADKKFTASYVVNVTGNQRPGVYNTTLLYVALATF
jgi:hypothetical protein